MYKILRETTSSLLARALPFLRARAEHGQYKKVELPGHAVDLALPSTPRSPKHHLRGRRLARLEHHHDVKQSLNAGEAATFKIR